MEKPDFTRALLILVFLFLILPAASIAQETSVMIRVQSKDAKFIGSSIGGAKIIVKEAVTGEILAEGTTKGSTGETDLIMKEPRERGKSLSDEETAGFMAVLDIDKPVFVTIEAIAPIQKRQAAVKSSTQLWIIPGKNITGDGIVLEVPGFVVDILSPQTHERIASANEIDIKANVVMMCGCPVTSGGIWDADKYEVTAIISKEGEKARDLQLTITDKPSTFSGKVTLPKGNYNITVYAFDPATGNTGLDSTNIIINE